VQSSPVIILASLPIQFEGGAKMLLGRPLGFLVLAVVGTGCKPGESQPSVASATTLSRKSAADLIAADKRFVTVGYLW